MDKIALLEFARTMTSTSSIDDLEKTYRRLWKLLNEKVKKTTVSPKVR